MSKRKQNIPRPQSPPGPRGPWIKSIGGIVFQWIPNPVVVNGGYWRRARVNK